MAGSLPVCFKLSRIFSNRSSFDLGHHYCGAPLLGHRPAPSQLPSALHRLPGKPLIKKEAVEAFFFD